MSWQKRLTEESDHLAIHMGVSKNQEPECRPQNSRLSLKRTTKKRPPIFGNSQIDLMIHSKPALQQPQAPLKEPIINRTLLQAIYHVSYGQSSLYTA